MSNIIYYKDYTKQKVKELEVYKAEDKKIPEKIAKIINKLLDWYNYEDEMDTQKGQ